MRLVAVVLLSALTLAGCSSDAPEPDNVELPAPVLPALDGFAPMAAEDAPVFSPPVLIDAQRAGGEPVIGMTRAGTLIVSAHPGFTHYHGGNAHVPTELVAPAAGQSYLWRSTDLGATWTHIGLPMVPVGPRSPVVGFGDPELTMMDDGAACYTDLAALAQAGVACSTDDGLTWLRGNPAASGRPNDRQWLASHGNELYFTSNYFVGGRDVLVSTDHGLTWTERGTVPCSGSEPGDLVARPQDGLLAAGCGNGGIVVSEDGGATWSDRRSPPGASGDQRVMAEPAFDAAGNVWITWVGRGLHAAGSPDAGLTWPWVYDLTPHFQLAAASGQVKCPEEGLCNGGLDGTFLWPWISAGSEGRFAVTWMGGFAAGEPGTYAEPWFIFTAFVYGATGADGMPSIVVRQAAPEPIHVGNVCQSGTTCQVSSMQGQDRGDRRLGDFFETTIGHDGYLYGAWANTGRAPGDSIAHPEFAAQVGGLRLISDADLGTWIPTQG